MEIPQTRDQIFPGPVDRLDIVGGGRRFLYAGDHVGTKENRLIFPDTVERIDDRDIFDCVFRHAFSGKRRASPKKRGET